MSLHIDTGYGDVSGGYMSWTGQGYPNQIASPVYLPSAGTITNISFYAGGYGTTAYTFHALWYPYGSEVGRTGTVTWPSGRAWRDGNANISVPSGGTYWLGFYCNPNYDRQWAEAGNNSGTQFRKYTNDLISMSGAAEHNGENAIVGYCTFVPDKASANVWDSVNWRESQNVYVWDSVNWIEAKGVYVWDGANWVESK